MKKIEIEKQLDLVDVVDILSLEVKDHFIYKKEKDGQRCMGPFYLKGRYSTINEVKDFHDVFEFDIFASNEKLDGEMFRMLYSGYDYSLQGGCRLNLFFNVYGIYSEEEENFTSMENENTIFLDVDDAYYENKQTIQEDKKEDEEEMDVSMMEELLEEKDHVVASYSFVVIKPMDTYESIAKRFGVDSSVLREINQEKELNERDLIVLPYGSIQFDK